MHDDRPRYCKLEATGHFAQGSSEVAISAQGDEWSVHVGGDATPPRYSAKCLLGPSCKFVPPSAALLWKPVNGASGPGPALHFIQVGGTTTATAATPATGAATSAFGAAAATPALGGAAGAPALGAAAATPAFGTPQQGAFGVGHDTAPAFGAASPSAFGAPPAATAAFGTAASPFGAKTASPGAGAFGATSAFGAGTPGAGAPVFGQTASPFGQTASPFGAASGQQMGATQGSGQPPFQATQVPGTPPTLGGVDLMQAISYMPAYKDKR